ncbi:MAG: hypothetical protein ACRDZQ_02470 [Acidimicrobiales bacterium]
MPVEVEPDSAGRPAAVTAQGRRQRAVVGIQETWRVDEGWWRPRPLSRLYVRLTLDDGQRLTVYQDLVEGGWWAQRY